MLEAADVTISIRALSLIAVRWRYFCTCQCRRTSCSSTCGISASGTHVAQSFPLCRLGTQSV